MNMRKYKNEIIYCEFAPMMKPKTSIEDKKEDYREGKMEEEKNDRKENTNKIIQKIFKKENTKVNEEKKTNSQKDKTTKLIVKNVPFQATKDDIKNLLKPCVNMTGIRIPKKQDGTSRGFCFITLATGEDVNKAIEFFGTSTHLFGRKIILEKAES